LVQIDIANKQIFLHSNPMLILSDTISAT
jgi:hypothetical protein